MKRLGKIAVCLAGGLALNAGLRADDLAVANNPLPDNPYAPIAVRNIFGLVAPAPPPDPAVDAEKNLPKITPAGIMSVFGYTQVLFKVANAKAGQPTKEDYYTLSEGQRQDDIEVIKIDGKKNLVTFNNHGYTQELPLANEPSSGGAATASSSPGGMNPGMAPGAPGGGGNNGPGGFTRFGAGPGGSNGGIPNGNPGSNGNPGNSMGGGMDSANSLQSHIYQPEAPTMSAEDAQAMLIINHLKAQVAGDPTANLYPPTPHDQEAGVNSNSQ